MELFAAMAPLVAPALEESFERRDLCICATRVAIEVARFFGVEAEAVPVKVIVYNAAFARHVADNFAGVDRTQPASWGDNSWSVGIGYGAPRREGKWDGHLIAVADGCFADYAIRQAERPAYNIHTEDALVGPYTPPLWKAVNNETGTVVEYTLMADQSWRKAPDWYDATRRRPIVGRLIRALRKMEVASDRVQG